MVSNNLLLVKNVIIEMKSSLRIKKFREDSKLFFKAAVESVSACALINQHISFDGSNIIISNLTGGQSVFHISNFNKIYMIGAGKASAAMAKQLEYILGSLFDDSCIVTKYGFGRKLNHYECIEAGHPLPDINGIKAGQRITKICQNANADDLIINLLSGGASSLLICPADGITLEDKIATVNLLLNAGADIFELNNIRKHLSKIKGGNLAKETYPATTINLVISDVIGDDLSVIGSGLFSPDPSTFNSCLEIIKKYDLVNEIPNNVLYRITNGVNNLIDETPKNGEKFFKNIHNFIIGKNSVALNKIKEEAEGMDYETEIVSHEFQGEAKIIGKQIVRLIEKKQDPSSMEKPKCYIFGGETYVKVTGKGKGGRNQELVLSAALECSGEGNFVLLSGGTDGNDGPTDAAGAICDNHTILRAKNLYMNAEKMLKENDSYNFFKPLNDLIFTGPTDTNVMDIQIAIIG